MSSDVEIPRLKKKYREQIIPALQEEFKYANVMQIPGLTKIVVNMGVGEAARDCPSSPVRSQPSPGPASPLLSSSCVRACPSAVTSPCVGTACGSSLTGC